MRLPIDDAHFESGGMVGFVSADVELGEIYEDARLDVLVGKPAPALERVVEGLNACAEWDVERIDGGLRELAVFGEAVARSFRMSISGDGRRGRVRELRRHGRATGCR